MVGKLNLSSDMAELKRNGQPRRETYPGSESDNAQNHDGISEKMVNFKIGDNDTDSDMNSTGTEIGRRPPKLTRNRYDQSLTKVRVTWWSFGPAPYKLLLVRWFFWWTELF